MKRVLTAFVLAPAAVLLLLWGPPWLVRIVVAWVALLAFREYEGLVERHGIAASGPTGYAAGLLVLWLPDPSLLWLVLLALLALTLAMPSRPLAGALPRAGGSVLGLLYIFGAWRCGLALYDFGPMWLLFALAVSWVGDTAAYYAGRWFGRRKLAPEISPAKTWVGAASSLVVSLAFGVAYLRLLMPGTGWLSALALAAAGNMAGQIGDLAESALKRGAGVKDSGDLLPGHGGMLDRTDAALFAMPVILGLLQWVKTG